MDSTDAASAKAGTGLEGNINQGGKRQVTLLSSEAWDRVQQQLGLALDPGIRRANFLVSGIDLEETSGQVVRIGAVSIRIHGETKPCKMMEKACPGLRDALTPHWRGGAYGEVLDDGEIHVGDAVAWIDEEN
jgi:MOSC domain-containing protein YiiM